jgi:hypothetical protein
MAIAGTSEFWKQELMREDRRLQDAVEYEGVDGLVRRRSPFLERFALVTALIMRRLNEVDALTEEVKESLWFVAEYPCTVTPPHREWFATSEDGRTWRQPIENHYDLDDPGHRKLGFQQLCNYFLHHFAFEVTWNDDEARASILFNSDRTKDRLFSIALSDYLRLVQEVAFDRVAWVDMDKWAGRVVKRRSRPSNW